MNASPLLQIRPTYVSQTHLDLTLVVIDGPQGAVKKGLKLQPEDETKHSREAHKTKRALKKKHNIKLRRKSKSQNAV